jgi:hypothetical protein
MFVQGGIPHNAPSHRWYYRWFSKKTPFSACFPGVAFARHAPPPRPAYTDMDTRTIPNPLTGRDTGATGTRINVSYHIQ